MYMCTECLAYIQNRMCRIVQNTLTYSTSYTYNLSICKFRTNNTHLPKVTGRFKKTKQLKGTQDSVLYVMRINLGMNSIYWLSVLMRK